MPDFKPWQWATLIALLAALNIVVVGGLILVIGTYDIWANPASLAARPTVPPWATPTATLRPTFTPTGTPEVWPTGTPTRTPTHTPPPTATWTPLPTRTLPPTPPPTLTGTATPYRPPTDTPTLTPTRTPVPTRTPLPTFTATLPPTETPTPAPTAMPTNTPAPTPSPTASPTATRAPTLSPTPTATRTPMPPSPTPSQVPRVAAAPSATPSATPTSTPSSTRTPTGTPSATPTARATWTPAPAATPSQTPTAMPSSTATATPLPSPTATATATAAPLPSPTATATAAPLPGPAVQVAPLPAAGLAAHSVDLAWEPAARGSVYRIYTDMGTGYGMYLFKAETREAKLTDAGLRAGSRYQYSVRSVTPQGETAIASVVAVTPGQAAPEGTAHSPVADAAFASAAAPQPGPAPVRVTPAPTPLPPDTVILGLLSATDYGDEVDNTLTIVGEVRNDSHLDVGETAVAATFYDADGRVIGEASGETMLSGLAPGVRTPFMLTLPQPPGLANYSLRATARPINRDPRAGELRVITTRRFEDPSGFYHVAGVVENPAQRRIEQARVIVILYDRGGRVVNAGFAYPEPAALSPRDRADFDVAFTYYPKVFSHLAIAAGD